MLKKFFKAVGNAVKTTFEAVGDAVAGVVEGGARVLGMEKTADKIKAWRQEDNSWKLVAGVVVAAAVVTGVGLLAGGTGLAGGFTTGLSTIGQGAMTAGKFALDGVAGAAKWAAPAFQSGGFFQSAGGGAVMAAGMQMAGTYFASEAEEAALEEENAAVATNASANQGILAGAVGGSGGGTSYLPASNPVTVSRPSLLSRASQDRRVSYKPTDAPKGQMHYDYSTNQWSSV